MCICYNSADEANIRKQKMVYTDAQLPKNIFIEELPNAFLYGSMGMAIDQVLKELSDYDHYFKKPGVVSMHGGFGPMNYQ